MKKNMKFPTLPYPHCRTAAAFLTASLDALFAFACVLLSSPTCTHDLLLLHLDLLPWSEPDLDDGTP